MSDPHAEVLQRIVAALVNSPLATRKQRKQSRSILSAFAERYFANVELEDIENRPPSELAECLTRHMRAGMARLPNESVVRVETVFNNSGPQTVIDIVTDDRKFLIDSISIVMARRGISTELLVHPIEHVERSEAGLLLSFGDDSSSASPILQSAKQRKTARVIEAWIHLEIDPLDEDSHAIVATEIRAALADVAAISDDDSSMSELALELAEKIRTERVPVSKADVAEAVELLRWLATDSFQFLGYREYRLVRETKRADDLTLRAVPGSGLGLLREDLRPPKGNKLTGMSPDRRQRFEDPDLLIVTKDGARSPIVRDEYFEHVGVKIYAPDGTVVGERRFLGLFDASVLRRSVFDIPYLRVRAEQVMEASGFATSSHLGRELVDTLEAYPRYELFEVTTQELLPIAVGITKLQEKKQVRVFGRRDGFGRFLSVLVYVPRERFSTTVAERIAETLMRLCGGDSFEMTTRVTERVNARVHVLLRLSDGAPAWVDDGLIEAEVRALTTWWIDGLEVALKENCQPSEAHSLLGLAKSALSLQYRDSYGPEVAIEDLRHLLLLSPENPIDTALSCASNDHKVTPDNPDWRFKIYTLGQALTLSSILPLVESLGVEVVDERPFEIGTHGGSWLHDLGIRPRFGARLDDVEVQAEFQSGFAALWRNEVENDGLNKLITLARMSTRQIVILRAYCRYLRQVGIPFTPSYVESTLVGNFDITKNLLAVFESRFRPGRHHSASEMENLSLTINTQLDDVASLDEDRILRSLLSVIEATTRTNAYRGEVDPLVPRSAALSFKFDPALIPDLPLPRPKFEIWVYSPRVEGVHLRGGDIARGGLRWSDRRDDFRTEVLGLMKAQMVKNAVIVPVGAKGGFFPKQLPVEPTARKAEAIACYDSYVSSLLDITDNTIRGHIVPPIGVARRDSDDPYLVVAADKGTATFSDIANGVAARYGYWLQDAFASGGSVGYDHKQMGITARGAWESVRRHFRTLGIDVATSRISVVGIGDMSGDVFGNGMVLSPHVLLVAAFDHRHIFLDPEPDAATTFAERERLFSLPTSSWEDYNKALLSRGGGVWPRSAKTIPLTDEVRKCLGLDPGIKALAPVGLVSAILRAPVDLMWNGGIGTYVKASSEQHADVGDRANDGLRVNGNELRCRVIGEGGNLGFTQRGRIEFALAGGFINTDAIDNSAGVDCSDHEVNIKIALNAVVEAGELTPKARNAILLKMTDDVGELVLDDNRAQNLALAIARKQSVGMADVHARQIRAMELRAQINRELEFLPTEKQLTERQANGLGLTTPEFAVLLAYTKEIIAHEVLSSDVPDDAYLERELFSYFPPLLQTKFPAAIAAHRLRREIITTGVANQMVNHAGLSFCHRVIEETGATVADVVRAFVAVREVFSSRAHWDEIDVATASVDPDRQLDLFLVLRRMVERCVLWVLSHRRSPLDIQGTINLLQPGVAQLSKAFPDVLVGSFAGVVREQITEYVDAGVPSSLARRAASWPYLHTAPDIVELAISHECTPSAAGRMYWHLFDRLDLHWLWDQIGRLPRTDRWRTQARAALRDELLHELRIRTNAVLLSGLSVEKWCEVNNDSLERSVAWFADIRAQGVFDLATLTVALRQLRNLVV